MDQKLSCKVKVTTAETVFELASAMGISSSKWLVWAVEAVISEQKKLGVDAWHKAPRPGKPPLSLVKEASK
jgi:hypothetical protein